MIELYNTDGTLLTQAEPTDDSTRLREIMGYNMLTLRIELEQITTFPVGCWCMYQGTRYTMPKRPKFVRKHSRFIEYTLLMYSDDYAVRTTAFKNSVDGRLSFPLTATPQGHLQMVVDSLNADLPAGETPWTIGSCIEGTEKLITYDFGYCIDALQLQCENFDTEYNFDGRTVSLGKLELRKANPLPMAYGRGYGFKSGVGCEITTEIPPLERLYVQGGEDNIDPSTYAKTATTPSSKTLLLPVDGAIWYDGTTFYEDVNGAPYQNGEALATLEGKRRYVVSADRRSVYRSGTTPKVDGFFDGTEVYPKRVGTISSVVVVDAEKNLYDIVDSSIPSTLNYEDCLIAGETMTLIFQSGVLAGREFDVKYYHNAVGSKAARRFEIVPAEIDGEWMPSEIFIPAVGDTYAVFHCQLPAAYFDDGNLNGAEWDLMRQAVKYLYEHEDDTYTFSGTVDGIWAKKNWTAVSPYMALGNHVLFTDENVPNGVLLRVTAIKENINQPHKPTLTISNALVATELGATIKRQQRGEGGGFDPRERWERERLWGRTHRGLVGRVNVEAYADQVAAYDIEFARHESTVNSALASLRKSETYLQQCRSAVLDIRNAIADSSTWADLKGVIYRRQDNYVAGVRTIGDSGSEMCTIDPLTQKPTCTEATINMNIPNDL